jgi:hypothetical protein
MELVTFNFEFISFFRRIFEWFKVDFFIICPAAITMDTVDIDTIDDEDVLKQMVSIIFKLSGIPFDF